MSYLGAPQPFADEEGAVEREFVLMPFFRRLRERLTGRASNSANSPFDPENLPPDTYLVYPDHLGRYEPPSAMTETAPEQSAQESSQQPDLDPSPAVNDEWEPVATHSSEPESEVWQIPESADPIAEAVSSANLSYFMQQAAQFKPYHEPQADLPMEYTAPVLHEFEVHEQHDEDQQPYLVNRRSTDDESSRTVRPRRQITITLPDWHLPRVNWKLLGTPLFYGGIGFASCLLMFSFAALRRPASSILPKQQEQVTAPAPSVPQGKGYTIQPGASNENDKGYTLNGDQEASLRPSPVPERRMRRQSEPEVIVHHYTYPATRQARVLTTKNQIKRYSDLP
jgi:hypothetical protein